MNVPNAIRALLSTYCIGECGLSMKVLTSSAGFLVMMSEGIMIPVITARTEQHRSTVIMSPLDSADRSF